MPKKIIVLLVEDNPGDSRFVQELLKEISLIKIDIIIAETLLAAKNCILKNKIDIILLDLGLSDSQGIETYREVKKEASALPVVIVSGLSDERVSSSCLKEGAQDYLIKGTFDGELLFHVIQYSIERKNILNNAQKYSAIIAASKDAIYSVDLEGKINLWSESAENLFLYSAEEMIGQSISIIMPKNRVHEHNEIVELIKAGKKIDSYETIRVSKLEKNINVSINAVPILDNGDIIGISFIAHDITKLKENEEILSIEFSVEKALSESNDLNMAAHNILKKICEIMLFPIGQVWLIDQEKKALTCVSLVLPLGASQEVEKTIENITLDISDDLPGFILKEKGPTLIKTVEDSQLVLKIQKYFIEKFKSCFGFPIYYRDEVLGVVLFLDDTVQELNIRFKSAFSVIGQEIGMFINRKRLEGDILFLAQHDALTGLPNRKTFESSIEKEIMQAKKAGYYFAVFFLDIDFFKKVNDFFGHQIGDTLLQEISKRLLNSVRKHDVVSRFGGDEFALIISEIKSLDVVSAIAEKILKVISLPFTLKGEEIFTTVSIGISVFPTDGSNANVLLKKADEAMYFAKESGRNAYKFIHDIKEFYSGKAFLLGNKLHHAIERDELVLHYQPIFNAINFQVVGVEALVRWRQEDGSLLPPCQFIPIAAQSGLIVKLGNWVIQKACQQFVKLEKFNLAFIAINISIQQINGDLIAISKNTISETSVNAKKIIFEMTEDTIMKNSKSNIDIINQLENMGITVSIDDFGIGYSSLSYLQFFKIGQLKIDKSFVDGIPDNENSCAIIVAIIVMAKALNIKVVAEGVEKEAQFTFLKEKGCDYIQGFYLAKPMPEDKLLVFLSNNVK